MSLQRNIRLLTWFNFFTDFRLYAPVAIIYFADVSRSYALGASIFSFIMVSQAITEIPTGIFSDIIGRKMTMVLGAAFSTLAITFYALGLNYWILVLGAIAEGVSRAFYSGNNSALLYDLLAEEGKMEDYHSYSGKLSSMFQWALASSAVLGSFIANYSFTIVMWLSIVPQFLCLLIGFGIQDVANRVTEKENPLRTLLEAVRSFLSNANLRLLSISNIIDYATGEAGYQFQAAFFQTLWPIWAIGAAKTLSGIFAALGYHFSGRLITRFKAINVLLFGSIISSLLWISSLVYATLLSPLLMSITSFFFGAGSTAQVSLLQKEFTDKQRATMSSLNSLAGSLFYAIVVFVLGYYADKVGPTPALLSLAILSTPSLLLRWKVFQRSRSPTLQES